MHIFYPIVFLRTYCSYNLLNRTYVMTKLICSNYGFECGFIAEGKTDQVLTDFKKHMSEEHGIDYSKETVMQFIDREDVYP